MINCPRFKSGPINCSTKHSITARKVIYFTEIAYTLFFPSKSGDYVKVIASIQGLADILFSALQSGLTRLQSVGSNNFSVGFLVAGLL